MVFSQAISGTVYDGATGEKVIGASVYFANTSIGTITDEEGYFSIDPKFNSNTYLVINHIGYVIKTIDFQDLGPNLNIYMQEEFFEVPEVVLVSDPFSRRQKLQLFRAEFLGDNIAADFCTIENEDSIELYFNSATNTLEAHAEEPISVKNEFLGYELKFDLKEFKVTFRTKSLDRRGDNINTTIIIGHSFFEDLANNESKFIKRRNSAFKGSIQHFMRTLWNQNWSDEAFQFRVKDKKVNPSEVYKVSAGLELYTKKITFLNKKILIRYKNGIWSYLSKLEVLAGSTISLDQYGSYNPHLQLKFSGYMASPRIGDLLPLDYEEDIFID